jgi:hypothetical protein
MLCIADTHLKTLKTDGWISMLRGWTRIFTRQVITWTSYLYFYDKYRILVIGMRGEGKVTSVDKALVSIATGSTACLFSTPFDMLRTQIQQQKPLKQAIYGSVKLIYSAYVMQQA